VGPLRDHLVAQKLCARALRKGSSPKQADEGLRRTRTISGWGDPG
jgi:hypothetical protein